MGRMLSVLPAHDMAEPPVRKALRSARACRDGGSVHHNTLVEIC